MAKKEETKLKVDGNGQKGISAEELKDVFLGESSTDKAFKSQEQLNAVRMMLLTDPEQFINNILRLDTPNTRYCVAMASYIRKCIEHDYQYGVDQCLMQLGLMASVKAKRMQMFVDAIHGESRFQEGKTGMGGTGIMDKVKNWYGGQ